MFIVYIEFLFTLWYGIDEKCNWCRLSTKRFTTHNKVERCVARRRINTMSINSHAVGNTTQNSKVLTLPTARRAFFELVPTGGAESDDAAFSAPAVRGNCGATQSAPAVRTKLRGDVGGNSNA